MGAPIAISDGEGLEGIPGSAQDRQKVRDELLTSIGRQKESIMVFASSPMIPVVPAEPTALHWIVAKVAGELCSDEFIT